MQINGKELTREYLKELQALPLKRKIQISQARIIEFYNRTNGKMYVSFSGGKDSTVLLHIVRSIFPETKAVFSNTGLEHPEIVEFVKSVDNVDIIRPEKTFRQVIDECGFLFPSKEISEYIMYYKMGSEWTRDENIMRYKGVEKYMPLINAPFKVSGKCCGIMKKKPLHKYHKDTGVFPIVGTMTEDSELRLSNWLRTGCNSFNSKGTMSRPLSFWLEKDIIQYIDRYKIPYCKIYGNIVNGKFTGEDRTGCIFCLAGVQMDKGARFRRLKKTHPKLWDYCMRPKDKGGLGMAEVLDWINENIKHKNLPLDYGQMPEPLTLDLDFYEEIEK